MIRPKGNSCQIGTYALSMRSSSSHDANNKGHGGQLCEVCLRCRERSEPVFEERKEEKVWDSREKVHGGDGDRGLRPEAHHVCCI